MFFNTHEIKQDLYTVEIKNYKKIGSTMLHLHVWLPLPSGKQSLPVPQGSPWNTSLLIYVPRVARKSHLTGVTEVWAFFWYIDQIIRLAYMCQGIWHSCLPRTSLLICPLYHFPKTLKVSALLLIFLSLSYPEQSCAILRCLVLSPAILWYPEQSYAILYNPVLF